MILLWQRVCGKHTERNQINFDTEEKPYQCTVTHSKGILKMAENIDDILEEILGEDDALASS